MFNINTAADWVADDVDSSSYFLDALQQVPQLLETCVDSCGLKTLRQVCKPAGSTAIQAVQGYWMKVSSQSSETEPLRKVAKLLEHSRLHHLSVEILVEAGKCCLSQTLTTQNSQRSGFAQICLHHLTDWFHANH